MKNVFINSVLVVFALLVASCGRQPEAKVEVMSFNIRLEQLEIPQGPCGTNDCLLCSGHYRHARGGEEPTR